MTSALTRLDALVRSGRVHPLRPLAAPMTLPHRDVFARVGATLMQAVTSLLPEALAAQPAHLAGFPGLFELMQLELARGRGLGFTRLDVVCPADAPEHFQLLEVQAGDPSAMGWHDALAEVFDEPPALMPSHRRALEALTPGRRIAFVVLKDSIVESDHRLLAAHYAQHGWESACVDPSELHFDGTRLLARGRPVDAVFRDALDELLLGPSTAGGAALFAAVRADAVTLMNPFVAALADDKSLLEALSTPARWSPDLAPVLAAHVPCTRLVRDRWAEWEGARVDLVPFVRASREQLVLKPIDGYGGFGIVIGPFSTAPEWEAALATALASPDRYVVQRYHPLPKAAVSLFEDGHATGPHDAWVVHSLWFHPQLAGAFCRASAHPVVNVHQGGGLAPVFFRPPFG